MKDTLNSAALLVISAALAFCLCYMLVEQYKKIDMPKKIAEMSHL